MAFDPQLYGGQSGWVVTHFDTNLQPGHVEMAIRLRRHGDPAYPRWIVNGIGRTIDEALTNLLVSDQCDLPSWFAEHVLPKIPPEMIPALQARLMARRMGGVIPGPLALPEA